MSRRKEKPAQPINQWKTSRLVRWVDTDASGMVHTSALVRMMEETEYDFLRSRGLSVVLTDGRGLLGFPRLSASIEIVELAEFDAELTVELSLVLVDGKTISYELCITNTDQSVVANGNFKVAVCRFPSGDPPYAILTPEFVIEALTKPRSAVSY